MSSKNFEWQVRVNIRTKGLIWVALAVYKKGFVTIRH